ncbi:MAG: 2,3-bisphosphoglycerate-independent phosphoglycerate mutase [Phycisphaeraceae bacterium]|nr:2,3-bisphosphoglycerate-independent phosphoglycerate mutase [Phycisphaeraceae bacterium]
MTTPTDARAFRWSDLPTDAPMPLLERRRVIGEQAMLSQVFLRRGCDVPTHHHANEQFAVILSGRLRFGIGAEGSPDRRTVVVGEGEVLHLPANVPHSAFAEEDTLVLDIFSPPSAATGIDRPHAREAPPHAAEETAPMPTATPRNAPLVLIIRDGWGENPNPSHDAFNAVHLARTPVDDRLRRDWPWTLIKTSGEDVGLPDGTMGNSEVGHQNIGAGRVVPQESLVMTKACRAGLENNAVIAGAIAHAKSTGASVHLLGINSDAGVHGQLEHLFAILRACRTLGFDRVYVHLFTDGRDTGPFTGIEFARRVESACRDIGAGRIASVIGRYFAMDRDNRWERVQRAYACLTGHADPSGPVRTSDSAAAAIQQYYDAPAADNLKGDEFITPAAIGSPDEIVASRIRDGDAVIFYNYRGDRPRELSAAFVFPDDAWASVKPSPDSGRRGFDRGRKLSLHYVTMTDYWEALAPYVQVAFPRPPRMKDIAGEHFSRLGLRQFRSAETEKYPHVTFFFNDYRDEPFPGEQRENPQSPKVATYDLKPEMSAPEVRDAVLRRLAAPDCEDLVVVNFANGDMVGHTGNLKAATRACEVVDECVGTIVDATLARGGSLIITADHGNAEQMFDPETNSPHTAHTVYDVPLIVVGDAFEGRRLRGDTDKAGWFSPDTRTRRGRLGDILPTALDMLGLDKPASMTGESLLIR